MKTCPLCENKVVYVGLNNIECLGPTCPNYTKDPPKLPETECEWNKIFSDFGNPWGLYFSWVSHSQLVARIGFNTLMFSEDRTAYPRYSAQDLYSSMVRFLRFREFIT